MVDSVGVTYPITGATTTIGTPATVVVITLLTAVSFGISSSVDTTSNPSLLQSLSAVNEDVSDKTKILSAVISQSASGKNLDGTIMPTSSDIFINSKLLKKRFKVCIYTIYLIRLIKYYNLIC